jgi:hypothetical protein
MLMFFASASDFTRRLTSVEANAKFSRLDAGPEEDWEATSADLKAVVTNIKTRYTSPSYMSSPAIACCRCLCRVEGCILCFLM